MHLFPCSYLSWIGVTLVVMKHHGQSNLPLFIKDRTGTQTGQELEIGTDAEVMGGGAAAYVTQDLQPHDSPTHSAGLPTSITNTENALQSFLPVV